MPPKLCGDRIKLFKYRNIRGETGTNYADTDTDAHAHMQAQKSVKNFIDNISGYVLAGIDKYLCAVYYEKCSFTSLLIYAPPRGYILGLII